LRMLMPSLRGVVVHDGYSNLVWFSDDWDLNDQPQVINDAIANALSDSTDFPGVARTIDADRVVYAFAVRGEHIELLGVVSLICRLSGTQIEPRPLQKVRQLVQPALECLRRELTLRAKLGSSERDLGIRERDLELMMEISSNQSATVSDADEFSVILKTGLDRMGCALAALWVPDKNISVCQTRSGQPMSPEALQRAQHHLMAWMQMQQRTIVVNHISKVASDVAASRSAVEKRSRRRRIWRAWCPQSRGGPALMSRKNRRASSPMRSKAMRSRSRSMGLCLPGLGWSPAGSSRSPWPRGASSWRATQERSAA